MKASVVIITKNQKGHLEKTLPILLKQNLAGGHEIIVVDSGSTDGAREYAKSFKKVKLVKINPKIFNFAAVFNTGAKKAKGKYLVRLSGDAIPLQTNFLQELLKPFENPQVGGTYGRYTISGRKGYVYPDYWPENRFPSRKVSYTIKPNPIKMIFNQKHQRIVFNFAGGCCALQRKIWQKRPFNEKLSAAEDAEYAWFLHAIGYNIVYVPTAVVLHEHLARKTNFPWYAKWQRQFCWQIGKYYLLKLIGVNLFQRFSRVDF